MLPMPALCRAVCAALKLKHDPIGSQHVPQNLRWFASIASTESPTCSLRLLAVPVPAPTGVVSISTASWKCFVSGGMVWNVSSQHCRRRLPPLRSRSPGISLQRVDSLPPVTPASLH